MFSQIEFYPSAGSIVAASRGTYWHKGIVHFYWMDGAPMVISFGPSGIQITSWLDFTKGQQWVDEGYPSETLDIEVISRALNFYGKPYQFLTWNCEHHVYSSHGLKPKSSQVNVALGIAAVAVSVALFAQSRA